MWELWCALAVPLKRKEKIPIKGREQESFLHVTHPLPMIHIPSIYYQNISKHMRVMKHAVLTPEK